MFIKILAGILATIAIGGKTGNLYAINTTVYEVEKNTVVVESVDGNLWAFGREENVWTEGDRCILVMDDMGTKSVCDDTIIMVIR